MESFLLIKYLIENHLLKFFKHYEKIKSDHFDQKNVFKIFFEDIIYFLFEEILPSSFKDVFN